MTMSYGVERSPKRSRAGMNASENEESRRPGHCRRSASTGSIGSSSSGSDQQERLSPPPSELVRMFPYGSSQKRLPYTNSDVAQCVLGVPNHNLHCYPVGSSLPSTQGRLSPDEEVLRLKFIPHFRKRQSFNYSTRTCSQGQSILFRVLVFFAAVVLLVANFQNALKPINTYIADYQHVFVPNVNDPNRAIFLISMGRQAAESKIVERFLMSTRRRGHWNGHVVLLTDAPRTRYESLEKQDDHFIVMHPRPEHFNWETKHDMPYKRFKTYVLDYVDSDPRLDSVRLVYYLDVDIIVGNSLSNFFEYVEHEYNISSRTGYESMLAAPKDNSEDHPSQSNIYFFKGNFAKTPVQGGQIILERDSSRDCLLWWRSFMDSRVNETKDQPFLKEMLGSNYNNTHNCHLTIMTQEPHLHFPSKDSVREMNAKSKIERVYPTLIHIKNTGKVREIPEEDETDFITDILYLPLLDSSHLDVGRKMHFDPDEPPWSPNHKTSSWTPTYYSVEEDFQERQPGRGDDFSLPR